MSVSRISARDAIPVLTLEPWRQPTRRRGGRPASQCTRPGRAPRPRTSRRPRTRLSESTAPGGRGDPPLGQTRSRMPSTRHTTRGWCPGRGTPLCFVPRATTSGHWTASARTDPSPPGGTGSGRPAYHSHLKISALLEKLSVLVCSNIFCTM